MSVLLPKQVSNERSSQVPPIARSGYAVNSVFYTIQGEGFHGGRPAIFLRFSGCNLWSGREQDRASAVCKFCDTDFLGTQGMGGGKFTDPVALARHARSLWPRALNSDQRVMVVCTGGEPMLQLDQPLIDALHDEGFFIAVETNGTKVVPEDIDWVCVSPKANTKIIQRKGNELKVVWPQHGLELEEMERWDFHHFFLQPMDGPFYQDNKELIIRKVSHHHRWQVSIQTHKALNLP